VNDLFPVNKVSHHFRSDKIMGRLHCPMVKNFGRDGGGCGGACGVGFLRELITAFCYDIGGWKINHS